MTKMNSCENNYLHKNGPESPSILSVNPHAIPTVSAKMAHNQSNDGMNAEYDPSIGGGDSPMKEINDVTPQK